MTKNSVIIFMYVHFAGILREKVIQIRYRVRKKMKKKFLAGLAICMMFLSGVFSGHAFAAEEAKHVEVMFLHDTHSHLNAFATVENGESQVLGGFARIKTLINEQKEKNPDTLLLDAGDFSMGTLIQVV